mmetsp:Transcript_116856/g.342181  ORF Transcript_116856/g.342181 Transcript_116856/m.342181 type:complete len:240 (-) Transcript_116856:6-725(-)
MHEDDHQEGQGSQQCIPSRDARRLEAERYVGSRANQVQDHHAKSEAPHCALGNKNIDLWQEAQSEKHAGQDIAQHQDHDAPSAVHPEAEANGCQGGGGQEAAAGDGAAGQWPGLGRRPSARLILPVAHDLSFDEAAHQDRRAHAGCDPNPRAGALHRHGSASLRGTGLKGSGQRAREEEGSSEEHSQVPHEDRAQRHTLSGAPPRVQQRLRDEHQRKARKARGPQQGLQPGRESHGACP